MCNFFTKSTKIVLFFFFYFKEDYSTHIGILSHFTVKLIFECKKKEEKDDVCADLEDLLLFSFLVGEENFRWE